DQVSGNIAGGGTGAGGIAAGIGTLTKTTEAYVGKGASVTALAKTGKAGIDANTGDFGAPPGTTNAQETGVTKDFMTSAVDYTTNGIAVTAHGFSTGQEVIYTGESFALGGLVTGQHYFVIRIDADHFALATTRDRALAWSTANRTEIDLTDNGVSSTASHVV